MKVLVLNCGSSSLKYQLIDMENEAVLCVGLVERIGIEGSILKQEKDGVEGKLIVEQPMKNHQDAIKLVLDAVVDPQYGGVKDIKEVEAVGHRVVHGGEKFAGSVLITDEVKAALEECIELAPLHNPANIMGIEACEAILPGVPMVGVFDTAFHQTMPKSSYLYGLPHELYTKYGVRRYGFHGTSHRYVSQRAAAMLGKNIEDANTYRVSHPLAQRIFADTKSKKLPIQELVFDYTNNKTTKISILENLIGKSGWLTLKNLTGDSFEKEDYLIFAGYQDNGEYIDYEQCEKLFMLGVQEVNKVSGSPDYDRLSTHIEARKSGFMDLIAQRNVQFFDDEMTKLDKWAEDRKNSLEIELKQLDKDIKTLKTESKKILKLEEKLQAQKVIKEMESKRNKMRRDLFDSQDLVDKQKEDLIEKIEAKLNQKISEEELFTIRWRLI